MRSKKILVLSLLLLNFSIAGESLFGISDKSIGFLSLPYSSGGMARSYEMASQDSMQINFMNYSFWPGISNTSYSVKIGYRAAFGDDGTNGDLFNDVANFEGGFLAVPVLSKRMVAGIGLIPYTSMEQRLQAEKSENNYQMNEEILIKGGLSKAVFNLSYKITSDLGIGLGYEYIFGKISKKYRLEYMGSELLPLSFSFEYRFYGHGIVTSVHYRWNDRLTVGAAFRPRTSLDVRVKAASLSDEVNKSELRSVTLPEQFNLGMEYQLGDRWFSGFDLLQQGWNNGFKIDDKNWEKYYNDYWRMGFGIERKHSSKMFTNLIEKIDFRMGFFYGQLNHSSKNNPVNEYGLSFGFSMPIQRFNSKIDFSGIAGKRGSLDKNLYKENFLMFGITISASEVWFVNVDE